MDKFNSCFSQPILICQVKCLMALSPLICGCHWETAIRGGALLGHQGPCSGRAATILVSPSGMLITYPLGQNNVVVMLRNSR